MKIDCVILNYNDAKTVERLVRQIEHFCCFHRIVLVDNDSTDDSWERLKALDSPRIDLLRAKKNGGYGAGNNLGIRYAVEHNKATHVVIANPDVSFTEECIRGLARVFARYPQVGVAAAVMEDPQYKGRYNGWKCHGFAGQLLTMGPVSRRLFHGLLDYPKRFFAGKKAVCVDAVHGSMLMVDGEAFLDCGGYDEEIFLYQEEMVLASRMKVMGRRSVLLLTEVYRHEHSASISRSVKKELDRQRIREESTLYYMKHYLFINALQERIAKLWFAGIRAEVRLFRAIQRRVVKNYCHRNLFALNLK